MERYDYMEAVKADVREYIEYNGIKDYDELYDEMFISDSVTGNASGSYTFSTWQAEENLCHNYDLLKEAVYEFGGEPFADGPEAGDVTIRCYLLGQALSEVLAELGAEGV